MRRKTIIVFSSLLLTLMASAPTLADTTIERIQTRAQINVGYREDAAPFSYLDAQGKPAGYALEFCRPVVEHLQSNLQDHNIGVRYVAVPLDQAVAMLADGSVDLLCSATSETPARREQIAFSKPIFIAGVQVMVREDSDLQTLDDLKGKTLVAISRTTAETAVGDWADQYQWTLRTALDPDAALSHLQLDWAAGYARDGVLLAMQRLDSSRPERYRILPQPLSSENIAIAFQKDDPGMATITNAAIDDAVSSGAAGSLYQKYFLTSLEDGKPALDIPMSDELKAAFAQTKP